MATIPTNTDSSLSPEITFEVNFNTLDTASSPSLGNNLSDSRSVIIPNIGRLKHGDRFTLNGDTAIFIKDNYTGETNSVVRVITINTLASESIAVESEGGNTNHNTKGHWSYWSFNESTNPRIDRVGNEDFGRTALNVSTVEGIANGCSMRLGIIATPTTAGIIRSTARASGSITGYAPADGNISASLWVYIDLISFSNADFVPMFGIEGFGWGLEFEESTSRLRLAVTQSDDGSSLSSSVVTSGIPVNTGEWYHVVLKVDRTNSLNNGVKASIRVRRESTGSLQTSSIPFSFDWTPVLNSFTGNTLFCAGGGATGLPVWRIDEALVLDRLLTADEESWLFFKKNVFSEIGETCTPP